MQFHEIEKYKVAVKLDDFDLQQNNITIDDVLERSPEGMHFLKSLKESAIKYTDYEWPQCAFSMSMDILAGNVLVITFSETVSDFIYGLKNSQKIADHGYILLRELINQIEKADEKHAREIIRKFEQNVRDVR